jgi:hypothetical protein
MRTLLALAVTGLLAIPAHAQSIEGYWQDIAGRITYKRNALPADKYGDWYARPLDATYPSAKQFRRAGPGFEVADMNYDEKDYRVRVLESHEQKVVFERSTSWSPCRVHNTCQLAGDEMLCMMETRCVEKGLEYVDLRAEERFIRRKSCARVGAQPQAQGFPVTCN